MSPFIAEIIGTAILILLGNGVVANVLLSNTKGNDSGWIVITWGWGIAVFVAVFIVGQFSGAHINPAVTVGLAAAGLFKWSLVPFYIIAQLTGGAIGSSLVRLAYKDHITDTTDEGLTAACYSTIPKLTRYSSYLPTETLGTPILVLGVIYPVSPGFVDVDGQLLKPITIEAKKV